MESALVSDEQNLKRFQSARQVQFLPRAAKQNYALTKRFFDWYECDSL